MFKLNKNDGLNKNVQTSKLNCNLLENNKQNVNNSVLLGNENFFLYPIYEDNESLNTFDSENARYKLNNLQSAGIICVLENCLDQLAIIGFLNNTLNLSTNNEQEICDDKFETTKFKKGIFSEDILEPVEKNGHRHDKFKLQRDRNYIEQVLKSTLCELVYSSSFKYLVDTIRDIDFTNKDESNLFLEEYENCVEIKQLKDSIIKEETKSQNDCYKCEMQIDELKDKYEDIVLECTIKKDYIYKWENARNEQNKLKCKLIEKQLQKNLQRTKMNIEQEMRCSSEIDNYMEQLHKDLTDSINFWASKYTEDIEKLNKDITILKAKRDELQPKIQDTLNITSQHRMEMDKYLAEKERRAQEEALVIQKNNSAICIQAWWRGVMVRRCLGEFRKVKKGTVKDKGGKKKKK